MNRILDELALALPRGPGYSVKSEIASLIDAHPGRRDQSEDRLHKETTVFESITILESSPMQNA